MTLIIIIIIIITLHFIAWCSAVMLLWKNILGDYT